MKQTWKSAMRRRVIRTRLRFERLEDRSLLAVAAFTVNLYQDAGGIPGEMIADDTVRVGESFFVEIMAREYDPLAGGLGAIALDISWDPAVLTEIDTPFDPSKLVTSDLPVFRGGVLDSELGKIQNLRGAAFLSSDVGRAIGNLAADRFALLNFRAIQPAEKSSLSLRQGGSRIVTVPTQTLRSAAIYFEPQTVTVSAGSAASELLTEPPTLEVYQTSRDLPTVSELVSAVRPTDASPSDLSTADDQQVLSGPLESPVDLGHAFDGDSGSNASGAAAVPSASDGLSRVSDGTDGSEHIASSASAVWRNATNPLDVDGSQQVTPIDALIVINYLDASPSRWALPEVQVTPPPFYDVNGDFRCTPHDALLVINFIETQRGPEAEGEQTAPDLSQLVAELLFEQVPPSATPVCTSPPVRSGTQIPLMHATTPRRPPFAGTVEKGSVARISTAGTDAVFRTRRVAEEAGTDIEDILPAVAASWFRAA